MSTPGGKGVQQTQYPFFTSPGGVTPQETALADYDYGQNLLEGLGQFEGGGQGGGPIMSTMATQVAGGANLGKALDLSKASDINQQAQYGAFQNAVNIDQQNQANQLAENQALQSDLQSLISGAGTAAGIKSVKT